MKRIAIFLIILFSLQDATASEQHITYNHKVWNLWEYFAPTISSTKHAFYNNPKGGFCLRPGIGERLSLTTYYGAGKNAQLFFDMGVLFYGFKPIKNISTESLGTFFSNVSLINMNAMIGGRVRLGGNKFAFSFHLAVGCLTSDFSNASLAVEIGPMFEIFNFDVKLGCLVGGKNSRFNYVNIGYNIKSKKYRQTIGSKQERSTKSSPYIPTPYYPTTPTYTPCPSHIESGIYYESSLEGRIDNENDGIVGVYESVGSGGYKLGVIKHGNSYRVLYMSGGYSRCWEFGYVKAELKPSATTGLFKATWYMADFSENDNCIIVFDGIKMTVILSSGNTTYIKMYPQQSTLNTPEKEPQNWSGTGWALGSGYLVTNFHVIDGARTISIKGINGDFNKGYTAMVVATDKTNDIALLRILDSRFNGFGTIPYAVSSRIADKGESIFVLGYPITQVLGNEVKYTAGEINSRTGFQGDVATYQISAPVTHGNSGGPVFDSRGNVIGIVNSGITNKEVAENVGYAIKISYLKILIESTGLNIALPQKNTIANLSTQEKIKKAEKFVYYIECSK